MKEAHKKLMICIALLGEGGGDAENYAHININVPSFCTKRIQEIHLHVLHTICELIESNLFIEHKAVEPDNSIEEIGLQVDMTD
jgi:hypothetical protein